MKCEFSKSEKIERTVAKHGVVPLFSADLNNLPIILTRIVSRFRISIQNQNLTSAVQLALFSKYVTKHFLLFDQFSSNFDDSHVNLTKIVSQSHTCFRNKNRTSVARTATVFAGVIEFPCHRAVTGSLCLKGQCWDCWLLVFFMNQFPPSPRDHFKVFQKFARYWQVKVHHRYQQHQQQICHQYTQGLLGTDSWKKVENLVTLSL